MAEGAGEPASRHGDATGAERAAQMLAADRGIGRVVVRDRYGRVHNRLRPTLADSHGKWSAPPRKPVRTGAAGSTLEPSR
jgi:hypothetical protein